MKKILAAFQFLTIIPIRVRGELSENDIAGSSVFFPLVGLFQGAILAGASFISLKFFSPGVTAAIVMSVYLLTNGGFHMDGLSDTFDALSVKSSGEPEKDRLKRLAVMRDSASGPIGATAIALSLLFKYVLLKEVVEAAGYCVLLLMPVVSAWSMTMMMSGAKSARSDGLGKIFFERVKRGHALAATILVAVFSCAIYFLTARSTYAGGKCFFSFFLVAITLALCSGYILRSLCRARFGGLTGDNLGAIRETSEIILLLAAAIWL